MNNIRTVAPLLARHFIDDDEVFDQKQSSIKNDVRLGHYAKYVGRLEDSWILKTEITAEWFTLSLNDFATHVFSDAIVEKKKLKLDHDKLVFPIQLNFNINSLSFNNVDEYGIIQSIDPTAIDEYLDEQIISINDDFIEIGLAVWKKGKNVSGEYVLILVNASNIQLNEHQENAWKAIFDNKYLDYYKYFKSQFEAGRYLSDQTICKELIDEFDTDQNSQALGTPLSI